MIQPLYLNFSKMISERLFRIPVYQRHYSWQRDQRQDLFQDIVTMTKNADREHFMATVVCLDTGEKVTVGSDSYSLMEIVDGQQRLTTLVILLKALEKDLAEGSESDQDEARQLRKILQPSSGQYVILQTNHDNAKLFQNYLKSGSVPDDAEIEMGADRNLKDGIIDCEKYVLEWKEKFPAVKLLGLIKNNLHFIFQLFEDEKAVYTIFEVLNSRGLPVDWLDKCKSMLMGSLFECSSGKGNASIQIENNHKLWGEMYREIGLQPISGSEILSFAATLHRKEDTSRPLSEEDSLAYFRTLCSSEDNDRNIENVSSVTKWLLKVAKLLVELQANARLRAVTQIRHARLLAVALMAVKASNPERSTWLEQWERVTFRIHSIFKKDSRYSVGEYVRLARQIVIKKIDHGAIMQGLIDLGKEYPIEDGVNLLTKADCYNSWEEELRYLFRKYEEYLCAKYRGLINSIVWAEIWAYSPVRSIEHVYPKGDDTYRLLVWKGKIRGSQQSVLKHVNRLGNLVILSPSLNSQAGQKSFAEKRQIYKNANLFQLREIIRKQDWTLQEIEERELHLCKWIKQAFCDLKAI